MMKTNFIKCIYPSKGLRMVKYVSLIIFSLIFAESELFACRDPDNMRSLKNVVPSARGPFSYMNKIKVRDQGIMNTCYGEVAAQMVDAFRFARIKNSDENHLTSEIMLSAAGKVRQGKWRGYGRYEDIDFGFTCDAIESFNRYGSCNKDKIDNFISKASKQNSFFSFFSNQSNDVRTFVDEMKKVYKEYQTKRGKFCQNPELLLENPFLNEFVIQNTVNTQKVLNAIDRKNFIDFFKNMVKNICQKPTEKIPELGCLTRKNISNKGMRRMIHQALGERSPLPVGIIICQTLLTSGRSYVGLHTSALRAKRSDVACPLHAVMLIGRRYNRETGKCELLVRDSAGDSCNGYSNDWQEACGNPYTAGSVWIEEDALVKNTMRVSVIEEVKP